MSATTTYHLALDADRGDLLDEFDSYTTEMEREEATVTAREIGEAVAQNGWVRPSANPRALLSFSCWDFCRDALGHREALRCADDGYRDYDSTTDPESDDYTG